MLKRLGADETVALAAPLGLPVFRLSIFGLSVRRGRFGTATLLLPLGPVELTQEVLEPVGHALPYHVIVDPLQNIAESALVFTAETSSSFAYMGVRLHCCL
jgi:hypothetical protein